MSLKTKPTFLSLPLSKIRSLSTAPTSTFLDSYKVTPPIKPWPKHLSPKRLVSIINRQQNLDLALQIFNYASDFHPNFSHNYQTYHSIIFKLSRARILEPLQPLLTQLRNSRIPCGENLFIDVIRNYGVASKPLRSLKTFEEIEDFGVQRSVRSLNTLLNVFVQTKRFDLLCRVFRESKIKYKVCPNVFTFNILMKGLCLIGDVEGASKLFDEMPQWGLVPNVISFTTILSGHVLKGDIYSAEKVFGEILDRGWLPDVVTYSVLIDGYCRVGRLADAVKVMDDMEENGVKANDVTYSVVIEAYCREKMSGEARNLMDDMLDGNYVPSSSLCCKVIDALCEDGKVDDACGLWKKMLKKNCTPDNAIVSTLIHWLCKAGKVLDARKLFGEFEQGSIPSVLTYNTLIAGMCERGELVEAGRLWDHMVEKGCKPNAFTYNMLVKGFVNIGKAKEGVGILEEMLNDGCIPNKSTYKILLEGLRELGMEEEVNKVVSMAVASGKLNSDSWDFFLNEIIGEVDSGVGALNRVLVDNAT